VKVLSKRNSAAISVKLAIAIELPKTSCSQRTWALGDIFNRVDSNRISCESRGRNISRCSLKATGRA
jgi:hypothetical protein